MYLFIFKRYVYLYKIYLMLPPHIAECTRLGESFVGECTRPYIAITPLACHSSEGRWRWKMYKLLPRRTTLLVHVSERRAMCSRVARVLSCWDTSVLWCGTEKPTSNVSSLALGPNAEHSSREGEDTVYTSRPEVARRMFGDVWR
jgi:hypothetical protein